MRKQTTMLPPNAESKPLEYALGEDVDQLKTMTNKGVMTLDEYAENPLFCLQGTRPDGTAVAFGLLSTILKDMAR